MRFTIKKKIENLDFLALEKALEAPLDILVGRRWSDIGRLSQSLVSDTNSLTARVPDETLLREARHGLCEALRMDVAVDREKRNFYTRRVTDINSRQLCQYSQNFLSEGATVGNNPSRSRVLRDPGLFENLFWRLG